jgi:hypothetical protein
MTWGSITDWSPTDGFAMRWFPGLDPAEATLLRVRFAAVDCAAPKSPCITVAGSRAVQAQPESAISTAVAGR